MNSKEKILHYLDGALTTGIRDFLLVSEAPGDAWIHGAPRFLMVTSGNVELTYFHDKKYKSRTFGTGAAFYCGKSGYMFTAYPAPCDCISITFYADYMRVMNIHFDGKRKPPTELDTFHHTEQPLAETGNMLIGILDNIAKDGTYDKLEPPVLEALLIASIEDIKKQRSGRENPSLHLWKELDHYIRTHSNRIISRSSLAKNFNISPGYISHLFKKFTGQDLMSAITSYKLEHASGLLRGTRLPVKEISDRCGFAYTSYFIRCFKKHHGVTPLCFRASRRG